MKRLQKRYFYSSVISSIFFIIIYLFLDFDIFIALILTLLVFVGGILLFKEKDIREFNEEDINNYYFQASRISNLSSVLDDKESKDKVNNICSLVDSIIKSLRQRPKKVEQVFDFFDYYLDALYKIIYKYKLTKEKEELNDKDNKYIDDTYKYIDNINHSFEKQLKNMQEAKMLDIDMEIKMFEKNIGFEKENIKVGEEK